MKKFFLALFSIALLCCAGFAAFYFMVMKPSQAALSKAGASIAKGVESIFHVTPKVTINSTVVIQEARPILEVAVLTEPVYHDYFATDTWMMSTKELHLKGFFTAKAGFDLTQRGIAVDLNEAEKGVCQVRVVLPAPELLSFETDKYEVMKAESGWWNAINEQDMETAVNDMKAEATAKALRHGLLQETKRTAQERIDRLVHEASAGNFRFEVEYLWVEQAPEAITPRIDSTAAPQ
ncbi:DUF4230 domain-containing protein [candidate division KSB1 bacterium]|nr:DUF4230 domain-containing protein [candidate division KSB1 bacterium]